MVVIKQISKVTQILYAHFLITISKQNRNFINQCHYNKFNNKNLLNVINSHLIFLTSCRIFPHQDFQSQTTFQERNNKLDTQVLKSKKSLIGLAVCR